MIQSFSTLLSRMGLNSLRQRYLLFFITIAILLIFFAYIGWRYVDVVSHTQVKDIQYRTQALMRSRQAILLDIIPLLFHVNHPALPGFSGHDCPSGVMGYMPTEKEYKQVRALWRNFEIQRQTHWEYDIEALFIMGSCGSIAFSRHSDFDFWLCHRNDIGPDHLRKLQQKAEGIENWAADQNLETHFFLMNADDFRQGKLSSLSAESSGSAQYHLLLDEFYRTSVWLAGKHPVWWYVPPQYDTDYAAVVKHIRSLIAVSDMDFIDFGPMSEVPVNEFFGAAVWQMNKGLESPYKSVLKITLMEAYASEYPRAIPLAARFKQQIYAVKEKLDVSQLDPYIMLIEYLEQYLASNEDQDESLRREFVRHSFYVKLGLALSLNAGTKTWRHDEVQALVDRWGWDKDAVELLDKRKQWTVTDILSERKLIVDHLTRSYRFLSAFVREHADDRLINAEDLTVLGRKLYSTFEKKPGKIELFTRGVTGSIQEDTLTYLNAKSGDGEERWLLFRGKVVASEVRYYKPLKVTVSLVELLAWCYFNKVVGSSSQVLLHAPNVDLGKYDIDAIRGDFAQIAPDAKLGKVSVRSLKVSATHLVSMLYVNVGHTPPVVLSGKDRGLVSGSHDVLTYGADTSVVCRLEWFYVNSWQEVHVKVFDGVSGLMHWMVQSLNASMHAERTSCFPSVRAFSSHLSNIIVARLEKLYETVCDIFLVQKRHNVRYVIESGEKQFVLLMKDGKLKLAQYDSRKALLHALSSPYREYHDILFDKEALRGTVYSVIFGRNEKGLIQMFYLESKTGVAIYILDEFGAIYERVYKGRHYREVLADYLSFIQRTIDVAAQDMVDRLHCYRLERENYQFDDSQMDLELIPRAEMPFSLVASAGLEKGKSVISFTIDDKTVSSRRYGSKVFLAAAKFILTKYPDIDKSRIRLECLDLLPVLVGLKQGEPMPQAFVLKYKKLLESKLATAITALHKLS